MHFEHVSGRFFLGESEDFYEDEHDVIHEVDGIVPDDHIPVFFEGRLDLLAGNFDFSGQGLRVHTRNLKLAQVFRIPKQTGQTQERNRFPRAVDGTLLTRAKRSPASLSISFRRLHEANQRQEWLALRRSPGGGYFVAAD